MMRKLGVNVYDIYRYGPCNSSCDFERVEFVSRYATKEAADAVIDGNSSSENEVSSIEDYSDDEAPGMEL